MPVLLKLLLAIAGLVGFASRLIPQIRARRRSKMAERMIARKLEVLVREHNLRQTIAELREKREIEIPTLESAMASRADLRERIEGICLRVRALAPVTGAPGNRRTAAAGPIAGGRLRVLAPVLCRIPGVMDRPLLSDV